MADERCVFPGENPRTPGRWLNRDTAERLLRGEPLDNAVAADAREQAERLAQALAALSAPAPAADLELPGEAAALAAFREARTESAAVGQPREAPERGATPIPAQRAHGERTVSHAAQEVRVGGPGSTSAGGRPPAGRVGDVGVVRIGGQGGRRQRTSSRWGRSVRLGLSAVLAAGMVGGVAMAVGVGVVPRPFGGVEQGPAASTPSAAAPDERPLMSPSPDVAPDGDIGSASPEGTPGDSAPASPSPGSNRHPRGAGSDAPAAPGTGWDGAASACRDLRDGRNPGADRKRALERAAGGSSHVRAYCKGVLAGDTTGQGTRDDGKGKSGTGKSGTGTGGGSGEGGGNGGQDGKGGKGGQGRKGGDKGQGGNDAPGHRGGHRGFGKDGGRPRTGRAGGFEGPEAPRHPRPGHHHLGAAAPAAVTVVPARLTPLATPL
ncbi:hypothetical protein [Streptomyces griseus]|uniref:hypothetical protein n=1 Tax=Streptomyces griseus TaxID=1911 RepID=UPI00069211FA|nr:hypothetical protein [Streptomyces griseus]